MNNLFVIVLLFIIVVTKSLFINSNIYKDLKNIGYDTKLVHGDYDPDEITGNIIPPISLGTTFIQKSAGIKTGIDDPNSHGAGYFYSRQSNPTRGTLERALATSENANYALVFSSGMAAISTVIQLLKSGDHVIAMDDLYGGTSSYFRDIANPSNGINFSFIDMDNITLLESTINEKTKLIWLESVTNPLLKAPDIKKIATLAKSKGCILAVDSTFSSPYLMNPLELGADIVVHSATKFIEGHSDILMGVIVCNDNNLIKKIRFIQTGIGAVPSPFECYLTMRGLKTLSLRMKASQANAMLIANYLNSHPMIDKVIYPGLKNYKYYDIYNKQSKGPGTIISIYIKGDINNVKLFLENLKIFSLAVSLGAVESLICSPALMTHSIVPTNIREKLGITDNLLRISVGIEDYKDLINDLSQALNFCNK